MRKRLELYGWLLFLVGIVLWVIQTVLTRDLLGMLGGVAWLAGCSLFILSYKIKDECASSDICYSDSGPTIRL